MKTIRLTSPAIQVRADQFGATEHELREPGVLFLVLAHNAQDAKEAIRIHKEHPAEQPEPEQGPELF